MEPFVREVLCGDCGEDTVKFVLEHRFLPEPLCTLTEAASWKEFPEALQTYIAATDDKVLSMEKQIEMAGNLNIKDIIRIKAGYMMMLSHPDETAEILNSIALKYAKIGRAAGDFRQQGDNLHTAADENTMH
jgi:TRAP-type C4-dicarboxylate transport system substrate-binding protein